MTDGPRPALRRIAQIHAAYFLVTGIWPFLSRRSFEAVTGPKQDYWLVQVVGSLVAVIGASLAAASRQDRALETSPLKILAIGSAASLGAADVAFAARRRISRIYLADAAAEAALVGAWVLALREGAHEDDERDA